MSVEGATVAALAVHIAEALLAQRTSVSSQASARATTSASLPENPQRRKLATSGRGCGGSTA